MAEKETKPFYKRKLMWAIVTVIVIGVAASSSQQDATKVGDSSGSSQEQKKEQTDFKVGDVIAFDGKEITVTGVQRNYSPGQYYTSAEGKEYVRVDVTIDNKSKDRVSYNTFDWEMQDTQGDIKTIDSSTYSLADGLNSGDIAAGGKKTGALVFEVPAGDAGLTLHYKPGFWSDRTVNIKL